MLELLKSFIPRPANRRTGRCTSRDQLPPVLLGIMASQIPMGAPVLMPSPDDASPRCGSRDY